ncbi:MAG: chaperone modulator CbpM [Cyclobacteriaceae bacterium]
MSTPEKISIERICEIYEVDRNFVVAICEMDMISLQEEGPEHFISTEALPAVERMLRLHHDLGINEEGLHTIHHLLERMSVMQEEMRQLRNRLRLYEDL